jgi:hypothetical protein
VCVLRSNCAVKNLLRGGGGGDGGDADGNDSKNYILLLKSFSTAVLIGGRLLEFSNYV